LHPQNSQPSGSPHKGKTTPKPPQRQAGEIPRAGRAKNDEWPLPPSIFFPVLVIDKTDRLAKSYHFAPQWFATMLQSRAGCCFCDLPVGKVYTPMELVAVMAASVRVITCCAAMVNTSSIFIWQ
jgi:hypothetical protein